MKRAVRWTLVLIFMLGSLILLTRFLKDNSDPIQLQFYLWRTIPVALGWWMIGVFVTGFFIGALLWFTVVLGKVFELKRLKRELLALQKLIETKDQSLTKSA